MSKSRSVAIAIAAMLGSAAVAASAANNYSSSTNQNPSVNQPGKTHVPANNLTAPAQNDQMRNKTYGNTESSYEQSSPADTVSEQFDRLDKNHNGYLSKSEARSDDKIMDNWSKIDTNHDNKISLAEFEANAPAVGATSGAVTSGTMGNTRVGAGNLTAPAQNDQRGPRSARH